jgi:hypothetical protein
MQFILFKISLKNKRINSNLKVYLYNLPLNNKKLKKLVNLSYQTIPYKINLNYNNN